MRRRLRVHVLRADGTPAANQTFGITMLGDETTDAAGWLTLDPAPPWEFHVHIPGGTSDSPREHVGPVRMPLDRKSAELEMRLPR